MKKIYLLLVLCFASLASLQAQSMFSDYYLYDTILSQPDTLNHSIERDNVITIQSNCATPTGIMNSTIIPPPSYVWLQTNGYCNPSNYGKTGTVCWTFTPTQPNISINSGFSTLGCATVSFGPFNLFTCAPACAPMGSGFNFVVTPNQCYTWCMSYSGTPNSCNFTDFCPYFSQSNPLPIELIYFAGYVQETSTILSWSTASETNCDYFTIERTIDGITWDNIGIVSGHGNSTQVISYQFEDKLPNQGINYYRLKQIDYNGSFRYYGIVVVIIDQQTKILLKITNLLGQKVDEDAEGVKIYYYSDGSVVKKITR